MAALNAKLSGVSLYVLGDTSYGAESVDEVASEHVLADLVVHYGRAVLERTRRLPVYFVFGCQPMDVSDCVNQIVERIAPTSSSPLLIFYDGVYHVHRDQLHRALTESQLEPRSVFVSNIHTFSDVTSMIGRPPPPPSSATVSIPIAANDDTVSPLFNFSGRFLPFAISSAERSRYSVLYIGGEDPTLSSLAMYFNQSTVRSPSSCAPLTLMGRSIRIIPVQASCAWRICE